MATFFKTPKDFRRWLEAHHGTATELIVGFHRKDSGLPSLTWPESVDEALCVGWIDGIRRALTPTSYTIRFSPRRKGSIWSAVNVGRVAVLTAEGRMKPSGLKAFAARRPNKSGIYSYEQRQAHLEKPYDRVLRKNKAAAKFFDAQPPSYRKMMSWWIVSAKLEATRLARLEKLIELSAQGKRVT